jgi:hypothetical protein
MIVSCLQHNDLCVLGQVCMQHRENAMGHAEVEVAAAGESLQRLLAWHARHLVDEGQSGSSLVTAGHEETWLYASSCSSIGSMDTCAESASALLLPHCAPRLRCSAASADSCLACTQLWHERRCWSITYMHAE